MNATARIEDLAKDWLTAIEPELGRNTPKTFRVYVRHWQRFFSTVERLTAPEIAGYISARLREVSASTVRKERSALRNFLRWLVDAGVLPEMPETRRVARKAVGARRTGVRKASAHLTVDDVERILAHLPERGSLKAEGIPVRARFRFLFETALRPESTVSQLLWDDVTPEGLSIRAECDKNRWARTVPLSAGALQALQDVGPPRPGQRIFGAHDFRETFATAVEAAFEGRNVPAGATQYALKHARITSWFEEGASVVAVKYLTGITRTDTLDRYMRANRKAAEGLVARSNGQP